jgi:hypothetical protein
MQKNPKNGRFLRRRLRLVYFIRCESTGLVKIGKAKDPRRRLAELQVGSASPLVLVAVAPGGQKRERALHAEFWERRKRGEWFDITDKDIFRIARRQPVKPIEPEAPRTREDWHHEWLKMFFENGRFGRGLNEESSSQFVYRLIDLYQEAWKNAGNAERNECTDYAWRMREYESDLADYEKEVAELRCDQEEDTDDTPQEDTPS